MITSKDSSSTIGLYSTDMCVKSLCPWIFTAAGCVLVKDWTKAKRIGRGLVLAVPRLPTVDAMQLPRPTEDPGTCLAQSQHQQEGPFSDSGLSRGV